MGDGTRSSVSLKVGSQRSAGKALLETDTLLFRGDFRLSIPFGEIRSVTSGDGELKVAYAGGLATFELGSCAEKWAKKILNPKSLVDKLGVKPGSSVSVVGLRDVEFER